MPTVLQRGIRLLVFAAAVLAAGCFDSSGGRMEVTGKVNLVGQPIQDGTILFLPLDKQDTQQGAQITNGVYKIPRS
jgi:hypothetical protein